MVEQTSYPLLMLRDVEVTFQHAGRRNATPFRALLDINLEVARHEFICLLGPSGCGKSTLLNLVAGYLAPSRGEILVDSRPIKGPGTDRVMVFQEFALFNWRTVTGNVEFGLETSGVGRHHRREIASRFIEMVGLAGAEKKFPYQLSGGMKQRTAIARALAIDPEILLLDEPFGALDMQTRSIMQQELLRIWKTTQKTILFVTHSIEEAIFLGDRVHVMGASPGQIKETVEIPLPRPRERASSEFGALYHRFEELLKAELWAGKPDPVVRR